MPVTLTELLRNAQQRFSEILSELCEVAGLTQGRLARLAKLELQTLVSQGVISSGSPVGSMYQPTISKVLSGQQTPTYYQVYIWLRVVRSWYGSLQLAALCEKRGVPVPIFSEIVERKLWYLAGFVPPDELSQVEVPEVPDVKLIDHKERRWTKQYTKAVSRSNQN
jgi:hypothetical protein